MPYAGWLADVHFGRYKVIRWSMWIMWTASMLATLNSVVAHLVEGYSKANKYVTIAAGFVTAIGFGGYQANVIQFGLDQLQDASTTEITAFIRWYYWTYFSSCVVSEFTHTCLKEEYQLLGRLIVCVSITIVIVLSFIFQNILIKEPVAQNPLKLLYKVIHYAIKNKNPDHRSPFFYLEDKLPSRIEFGKSKYGGPFTTEQVEDVKTFLRLLVILVVASALIGEIFVQNYPSDHLINVLSNVSLLTPFSGECYREMFFITTLEYIATAVYIPLQEFILYPTLQRYLPSIKMYQMLVLGMVLQMARVIALMVFDITARKVNANHNDTNLNRCLLYTDGKSHGLLSSIFNSRWLILPTLLQSLFLTLLSISGIEFVLSQTPYSMRGLMIGVGYGSMFLFTMIGYDIYWPFIQPLSTWGTGIISCEFWYLLLVFNSCLNILPKQSTDSSSLENALHAWYKHCEYA